MATLKTQQHDGSVDAYLALIEEKQQRADALRLREMMEEITREPARMWGDQIIGFGHYHYRYASGREGDWFLCGFAPRKKQLSVYIMAGMEQFPELTRELGKFKTGKSCLYIRKLSDIDEGKLKQLISSSVDYMKKTYPDS